MGPSCVPSHTPACIPAFLNSFLHLTLSSCISFLFSHFPLAFPTHLPSVPNAFLLQYHLHCHLPLPGTVLCVGPAVKRSFYPQNAYSLLTSAVDRVLSVLQISHLLTTWLNLAHVCLCVLFQEFDL
jgi:hypothetical protein